MLNQGKDTVTHSHTGERFVRYISAQQDHISMLLKQMGADVKQINGLICFVRFIVGGTELMYVYNLNAKDEYYLQRVKPYPMSAGVFPSASEIADYIEKDLGAFRNAMGSGQFAPFVEANRRLTGLSQALEDVFMHYNVPGEYFMKADEALNTLEQLIGDIRKNAKPLPPEP